MTRGSDLGNAKIDPGAAQGFRGSQGHPGAKESGRSMSQSKRNAPQSSRGSTRSHGVACTLVLVVSVLLVGSLSPAAHGALRAEPASGLATAADAMPWPGAAYGSAAALAQATLTPTLSTSATLQDLLAQLDTAWNAQNWDEALSLIAQIMAIDPNYTGIQDRLYFAHVNYGYQLMTAGDCTGSLEQFRDALEVRPDGEEARMGLELLERYCATPVPATPTRTITIAPDVTATPTVAPGTTATPTPQTLTEPITYTVQLGDTLYSLARRYNTTVQAIMQANGMTTSFLRAGSVIWIPASGAPPAGPIVHIVQPGETLYSIARQYNTTVWAIMAANGLKNSIIYAYRALYIPTALQPGPIIHIVMPGETLFTIANHYGTTVPLVMLANGLSDYTIYVYQRLVIPPEGWTGGWWGWPGVPPGGPAGSWNTYVVQRGDTLYGIARRFGVTVAQLMAANGLSNSNIQAGMTLRIP